MAISVKRALGAPLRLAGSGLKAFSMRWSGSRGVSWFLLPRTKFNYENEVNALSSSIVVAVVGWIARNFPEAPVRVVEERDDGTIEPIVRHPLTALLEKPNDFYSGVLLWMATIIDRAVTGNAYWLKVRNKQGGVIQLWWAPSSTMEPKWPDDGSAYISHYEYKPEAGKEAVKVPLANVVHFRYGIDPDNVRKGLSPLRSVLREIFTDDEAANMTAALLRNLGVPGVVISPDVPNFKASKEDADEIKNDFMSKFGGDRRGEPMVMTAPTKVQILAFSPEQMLLKELRRIPEERVSGIFGVPAMVAGLGAGLERSTFTNMAEAREAAYEENIIPTQRLIAADMRIQLLPDFDSTENRMIQFDLAKVRVLQPDQDKLAERFDRGVRGGWVMVSEAKRAVGLPTDESEDYYLRQFSVLPVMREQGGDIPPSVLAGGAPKEVKGLKSPGFHRQIELARQRLAKQYEGEIVKFFDGQAKRAKERVSQVIQLRSNGRKELPFTAATVLPVVEDELLMAALRPLWLGAMQTGWDLAEQAFGLETGFNEASPSVVRTLNDASFRAKRINDGTRNAITSMLTDGGSRGLSASQIVNGSDDFPGIVDQVRSYYADRPLTIAQTESMWGTGRGTTSAYRENGHRQVRMVDGSGDPFCAARNGRVVSIEAGESALGNEHPHGTLSLEPAFGVQRALQVEGGGRGSEDLQTDMEDIAGRFPPGSLEGINSARIVSKAEMTKLANKNTVGLWDPFEKSITFRADADIQTVAHELAHAAQANLPPALTKQMNAEYKKYASSVMNKPPGPKDFPEAGLAQHYVKFKPGAPKPISPYSLSHPDEYFAETVSAYMNDPATLAKVDPKGYAIVSKFL